MSLALPVGMLTKMIKMMTAKVWKVLALWCLPSLIDLLKHETALLRSPGLAYLGKRDPHEAEISHYKSTNPPNIRQEDETILDHPALADLTQSRRTA